MEWIKKNAVTLIIILLSASFSVATAYQILISDIKILGVFAQETRKIVVEHIEDVKNDPLTEMQLQNKVENLADDVKDHDVKISNHHEEILLNKTLVGIIRADQKIMKQDIKEILSLVKKGD